MISREWLLVFMLMSGAILQPSDSCAQVQIQQPTVRVFSVQTTVSVPDGGSAYLGGIDRSSSALSQFPGQRVAGSSVSGAGVAARAQIIDFSEHDAHTKLSIAHRFLREGNLSAARDWATRLRRETSDLGTRRACDSILSTVALRVGHQFDSLLSDATPANLSIAATLMRTFGDLIHSTERQKALILALSAKNEQSPGRPSSYEQKALQAEKRGNSKLASAYRRLARLQQNRSSNASVKTRQGSATKPNYEMLSIVYRGIDNEQSDRYQELVKTK